MSSPPRPTSSVTAYIVAVGIAGVVALAGWVAVVPMGTLDLSRAVLVVLLGSLSVWLPLRFYRGGGIVGFNLLGAAFVTAVLTLPIGWAPALVGLSSLVGYTTKVRDARKVVFNVGQELVWAVVAAAAVQAVGIGPTPTDPRSLLGGLVGATAMVVLNSLLMQELFRRLEGRSYADHLRRTFPFYVLTLVANLIYGIVLAVTLAASAFAALLTGVLLATVSFGYRGFAALQVERVRITRLHSMSQELVDASQAGGDLDAVLGRVGELFGATRTELAVEGDAGASRRHDRGTLDDDDRTMLSVPIELRGQRVGSLTVRGRQGFEPWGESDTSLLESVANDLSVVLQNHRLFEDVERERSRLATETSKLSDILAATSDGITLIGTDDLVASWNPAMARLTGLDADAAIGRPWYGVLRLRDELGHEIAPGDAHVLSMALKGVRSEASVLWQAMRDDGVWRWVRCTASPVERGDGEGAVLVVRDVTAETEVDQLKNDFIATVSHELRTPMTPLKGFLSTLTKHGRNLDDDQRDVVLTSMDGQIRRLDRLVGDLLAVAELAQGQFDLTADRLALRPLVETTVGMRSHEDAARVSVEGSAEVSAWADPEGARRVVDSLLDNALKHTTGRVRVRISGLDTHATVEVVDEGPGIAARDHDRIFERFVRLGNHLHRTQGPGLGLTIARALVQQMGGSLRVRSRIGAGATFEVRLPLATRPGPQVAGDSLDRPSLPRTHEDPRGPAPTSRPPRSTP